MSTVRIQKVKVQCPKCGEKFEVDVSVTEAAGNKPRGQILLLEVTSQASPEASKIWENRKKQIGSSR